MDINTVDVLSIDIAADMRTFINNQTLLTATGKTIRGYGTEQAGSDDEVIVSHTYFKTFNITFVDSIIQIP